MKRLALFFLFFGVVVSAQAAVTDGITLTSCVPIERYIQKCTIHFANDTGTDIGPQSVGIPAGFLMRWKTVPDGTNAPTALYDVKILEDNDTTNGLELIENIDNQSATANGGDRVLHGGAYGPLWHDGTIYVFVSGLTNGNDDEGDIIIWIDTRKNR